MKPIETWRKNNWRFDLRKYTRSFEQKFKVKREKNLSEAGKVYAITYRTSPDFHTDKHHVTPILVSFGRFRDEEGKTYVRGLNLLFLRVHQTLEILEDIHTIHKLKPDNRASKMIEFHEKYIRVYPYLFKNFEERRILTQDEVIVEDWGMIPLLKKNLWGTFNSEALNQDFQLEEKEVRKLPKKSRPRKVKQPEREEELAEEELINTDYGDSEGTVDLD